MLRDALAIIRYHIVGVAMAATLVFGWLFCGRLLWEVAAICGVDWFVINLANRVTDVGEDLANGIQGTERVAGRRAAVAALCFGVLAVSFLWSAARWPALTPWRLAVQAIGLVYNFRLLPARGRRTRLKELYFFKNFGSAAIFVLTCFAYPLALGPRLASWGAIASLALFFVLFEHTYEILYDLRDLEGDRAEGIPTYPVAHGPRRAQTIIDALLAASAAVLAAAFLGRVIGVRELLMIAAPALQLGFYRWRLRRGPLTSADCVWLTHLGTALLLFYLAGNQLWLEAGLPANLFLPR